jgi:hypothetical protein
MDEEIREGLCFLPKEETFIKTTGNKLQNSEITGKKLGHATTCYRLNARESKR